MMSLLVLTSRKQNTKGRKLKPEYFHLFLAICQEGTVFCKVKNKRKNAEHFMLHKCNKYTFQDIHYGSQSVQVLSKITSPYYTAKKCLQNWSMAVALDIFKD